MGGCSGCAFKGMSTAVEDTYVGVRFREETNVTLCATAGKLYAFGDQVVASRPNPVLIAGLAPVWQGYLPVPFTDGYEEGLSYGETFVQGVLHAIIGP